MTDPRTGQGHDGEPPYVAQWTERIAGWPSPLPRVWDARLRVHRHASSAITAVQNTHLRLRDVLLRVSGTLGVPENRIDAFRERHARVTGWAYDLLRRAHWYF